MKAPMGARVFALALVVSAVALLFHTLPDRWRLFHSLAQYLFFLPIVMAGLWFGWRGGLATAVLCTLIYLPRLSFFWRWGDGSGYTVADVAEAVDLLIVGSVLGILADRERRKTQALEQTTAELRATYAELQHSLEHLKRAERLSGVGQLSANLAHEIRNPLASIEGAAGLLENSDGLTSEQRTEFSRIIRTESRRLSRLLTDLLNYSRPMPPRFQPADMRALVETVVSLVSATARRAEILLQVESAAGLPPADCDTSQVQQVLLNLLLNAIQASPPGRTVVVRCEARGADMVVEVRDEGPGIPPSDADRIFSPFYTTKPNGTGLGLAVAQQIAVSHGGEITVGANSPRGAVFALAFPLRRRAGVTAVNPTGSSS